MEQNWGVCLLLAKGVADRRRPGIVTLLFWFVCKKAILRRGGGEERLLVFDDGWPEIGTPTRIHLFGRQDKMLMFVGLVARSLRTEWERKKKSWLGLKNLSNSYKKKSVRRCGGVLCLVLYFSCIFFGTSLLWMGIAKFFSCSSSKTLFKYPYTHRSFGPSSVDIMVVVGQENLSEMKTDWWRWEF